MPRNVRNFWLDAQIDGRASSVETGPAAKDGGFGLSIAQRADGDVRHPVRVTGRNLSTGENHMNIDVDACDGIKILLYDDLTGEYREVTSASIRIVSEW